MREIKFKGLNTKGEWVFGSLVTTTNFIKKMPNQHSKTWIIESAFGNGGWFNVLKKQYVKPETVVQFTGLKDKNGVEIYEGDILKTSSNGVDPMTGTKCDEWEEIFKCPVKWDSKYLTYRGVPDIDEFNSIYHARFCEVIGNIHENPDLLK